MSVPDCFVVRDMSLFFTDIANRFSEIHVGKKSTTIFNLTRFSGIIMIAAMMIMIVELIHS